MPEALTIEQIQDKLNLKTFEEQLGTTHAALEQFIEKHAGEVETAGEAASETKAAVDTLSQKATELGDQIADIEQRIASGPEPDKGEKSVAEQFTESDQWKAMQAGQTRTATLNLKTAIVNATGQNQPLVPAHRLDGVIHEPNRVLRVRDVLPVGRTTSNLIEYAKENVFTNSAAVQGSGSPIQVENVTKAESGITFTLANNPVVTLAHWIPASKQVLADAPMLQSYISTRLLYGLKLKEETEILNANGNDGTLDGLVNQQTAYAQQSPEKATSNLDIIRDAKRQAAAAEYDVDTVFLNPQDWANFEMQKDSQGRYLIGQPHGEMQNPLWGMRTVISNSVTAGTFLVMASAAAQIWDREDANVQVSLENSDNFVKNMCTILAEERIALTVYRPAGIIGGSFTF